MNFHIVATIFIELSVCYACRDWWETAQFYQIYPRSFKDSNGDGIGDLNGITQNLNYLKDIGVTATWLSPIFKSPMVDFGYDISNFTDIHEDFGTLEDFDRLIEKAKQLNIKIILDFVPNHSSDQCEWFQKSVNREPGYEDFYVWENGKDDPENPGKKLPPSNWLQAFRGSAWEWNEKRRQFYLHQFSVQQPDLNYRNPRVVETMKSIMKFWLDRGVSGFRVDAVPCLFEVLPNKNGEYPDEPRSNITDDPQDFDYLKHIYTQDQPETIDMIYQWRKVLDDYQKKHGGGTRVFLAETASPMDVIAQYYGNSTHEGAHLPFNFNLIFKVDNKSDAFAFHSAIDAWLSNLPKGRTANWVIGNHDRRRVGSRFGQQMIDTMNMIAMVLPGASVTYYGEEIGMLDGYVSWNDTVDPAACNTNPEIFDKYSRDPARTPFQWDGSKNAGFSSGAKTWLPIADSYKDRNVETELQSPRSHLKVYKHLSKHRNINTLKYGGVKYQALNKNVLVIIRQFPGNRSYVLLANISGQEENVNIDKLLKPNTELTYSLLSLSSQRNLGDKVLSSQINLKPYESFILRT